jgi:hypothetical protein
VLAQELDQVLVGCYQMEVLWVPVLSFPPVGRPMNRLRVHFLSSPSLARRVALWWERGVLLRPFSFNAMVMWDKEKMTRFIRDQSGNKSLFHVVKPASKGSKLVTSSGSQRLM